MGSRILRYFDYAHLPSYLQATSKPFHELATWMDGSLPMSDEKSAGMRKLLEAKDCMVRAAMDKYNDGRPLNQKVEDAEVIFPDSMHPGRPHSKDCCK